MDIGYIISSNIRYQKPLEKLLNSMISYGVKPANIFVAVGGSEVDRTVIDGRWYERSHNSFDYTGLIELILHTPDFPEYIMTLQDTTEFTEHTHDLILNGINVENDGTAVYGGQCNLVVYRYSYLLEQRDYILSHRDMSKLHSIQTEGELWRMIPDNKRGHYNNSTMDVLSYEFYPYGTGIPRIVERYNAIQLLKYKANYGQSMHALITEA